MSTIASLTTQLPRQFASDKLTDALSQLILFIVKTVIRQWQNFQQVCVCVCFFSPFIHYLLLLVMRSEMFLIEMRAFRVVLWSKRENDAKTSQRQCFSQMTKHFELGCVPGGKLKQVWIKVAFPTLQTHNFQMTQLFISTLLLCAFFHHISKVNFLMRQ